MRVKVKNPRVVVYCPQQAKVVSGKEPVEVVYTQVIRDALRDGLITEVEKTKAELAKEAAEAKAKKEADEKIAAEKLAKEEEAKKAEIARLTREAEENAKRQKEADEAKKVAKKNVN